MIHVQNDKDDGGNRGDLDPKGEKVNNNTQPGGEDGDAKAKSSSVISKHQEQEAAVAHQVQHYPDLTDMTEMDYSPARRKPPIHNWVRLSVGKTQKDKNKENTHRKWSKSVSVRQIKEEYYISQRSWTALQKCCRILGLGMNDFVYIVVYSIGILL